MTNTETAKCKKGGKTKRYKLATTEVYFNKENILKLN